ncbi:hypothetical protein AVEN_14982-1 [Araneus ventricosus]|uniref:Uncharacterized protein n=1 Tax=Araneus ventricosus TaxID=182803 RepID=A0A4Y2F9S2_ARAVE|nr:hypothetical protein AVEN_14982-1 [Araneus ventricosus]
MRWKKKQIGRHNVIGRMSVVGIWDTDRYYLRMLLHKSGAVRFDNLKAVSGILCETAPSYALAEYTSQDLWFEPQKTQIPGHKFTTDILLMFSDDILLEQSKANKNKEKFNTKQRIVFETVLNAYIWKSIQWSKAFLY